MSQKDDQKFRGSRADQLVTAEGRYPSQRSEPFETISTAETASPPEAASTEPAIDEVSEVSSSRAITTESDLVTATLLGLPHVEIHELVYDHRLDSSHESGETRPLALFDIENTWNRPLFWQSARTTFIGDDGYVYQSAHMALDLSQFGPGCHARQVKVEPGCRARMVTLVEALPSGVEVDEIVHTISPPGPADNQRLRFSLH